MCLLYVFDGVKRTCERSLIIMTQERDDQLTEKCCQFEANGNREDQCGGKSEFVRSSTFFFFFFFLTLAYFIVFVFLFRIS